MTYPVTIGDKEYTKKQLLEYGQATYPKFYWIPRGIGLGFVVIGFLALLTTLVVMAQVQVAIDEYNESIKNYQYIHVEPESMPVCFYVYIALFIIMMIAGFILLIVSVIKKPDQAYIDHAYRRLNQIAKNQELREANERVRQESKGTSQDDPIIEELKKYKRLLDEGLITQEVYNAKQEEYLNGRWNPRD